MPFLTVDAIIGNKATFDSEWAMQYLQKKLVISVDGVKRTHQKLNFSYSHWFGLRLAVICWLGQLYHFDFLKY